MDKRTDAGEKVLASAHPEKGRVFWSQAMDPQKSEQLQILVKEIHIDLIFWQMTLGNWVKSKHVLYEQLDGHTNQTDNMPHFPQAHHENTAYIILTPLNPTFI